MLRTLPFAHGLEAFFAARADSVSMHPRSGIAPTSEGSIAPASDGECVRGTIRFAHALGTRVLGVGKFLLLLGALAATFLLFFGISMRVALRSREVEVPQLVGRTVNEATQTLLDLGLALRIDDNRRSDEKVAAGRIMQQDPAAGVQARQQRTVRVWVSSGARTTTIPVLVGQTERTARFTLESDVSRSPRSPSSAHPITLRTRSSRRTHHPDRGRPVWRCC
jgi:hypothetical protein